MALISTTFKSNEQKNIVVNTKNGFFHPLKWRTIQLVIVVVVITIGMGTTITATVKMCTANGIGSVCFEFSQAGVKSFEIITLKRE